MDLVIRVTIPAPQKASWHDPDVNSRGEWSDVYELITTWFCSSHDFNKEDNVVILYQSSLIKLDGSTIRYLGPSLRSAASLVSKAFQELPNLSANEKIESTPGIFVYRDADDYTLPQPYYQLITSDHFSEEPPTKGSLFCFTHEQAQQYYVPASRLTQGIVWFLQSRFQ